MSYCSHGETLTHLNNGQSDTQHFQFAQSYRRLPGAGDADVDSTDSLLQSRSAESAYETNELLYGITCDMSLHRRSIPLVLAGA